MFSFGLPWEQGSQARWEQTGWRGCRVGEGDTCWPSSNSSSSSATEQVRRARTFKAASPSSWELKGTDRTQILRTLVCRQSQPQGQVQNYSCTLTLGQGRAWLGSHQQGSVNSSHRGPRHSLSSNVFPVCPGEWFRAKVTVGLEPRWKDLRDHKTRSLVWWPGKEGVSVCGGQWRNSPRSQGWRRRRLAVCLLMRRPLPHEAGGEGDPTVSHPGRGAVCPEPRGEGLWISHSFLLWFYV